MPRSLSRSLPLSRLLPCSALLAGACAPPVVDFQGDEIYRAWPFDELRSWAFQADDTTVPYRLEAAQAEGFEEVGDAQVFTITFVHDCFNFDGLCVDVDLDGRSDIEGTPAFTWKMSSDREDGVRFHAFNDTTFEPAVLLAEGRMKVDASSEMSSGGIDYVASYEGEELCPAPGFWPNEDTRPTCFRNQLSDGEGNSPVAGTYWSTTRIGLTAFQPEGGPTWQLRDFEGEE